jgi:hypothetical protein
MGGGGGRGEGGGGRAGEEGEGHESAMARIKQKELLWQQRQWEAGDENRKSFL